MKTNPIFQVLVVSNTSLIAEGSEVDDLAVGQLGIFDAETRLSVASTSLPDNFFFAVGLDKDGDSVLDDVRKSAGEYIPKAKINTIFSQAYEAGSNQTISVDLTGFDPQYNEDYTVRFEFMSGASMALNGFTNPVKSFTYTTPNTGTGSYSLATFITNLVDHINNDPEGIIVASAEAGDVVLFTIGADPKANTVAGINPKYHFLRQYSVKMSLKNGFEAGGYATPVVTPPVYEQGSGYDIQREEFVAGGWIGEPGIYRDSQLNGLFATAGFTPLAVVGTHYWQMRFNYNYDSNSGGMLNYSNQMETLIAIPDSQTYQDLIDELVTMGETLAEGTPGGVIKSYS